MLLLLEDSHGLDIGWEGVRKPYNIYLLLSNITLYLLYIIIFKRFNYFKFERSIYSKFVKLRRLYCLLISGFSLGIYVLISLKRNTLVLLFPVFFLIYDFIVNLSLNIILLSLKKATGFDSKEVK